MERFDVGQAGVAIAVMAAAAVLCLMPAVSLAEEATDTPTFRSSRSTAPHGLLEEQLQQIADNDQQILAKFASIMDEMKIVKIRVLRQPQLPPSP